MIRVSGMAERAGRMLFAKLLDEGLLVSRMPKGPVRLAFPTHVAGYLKSTEIRLEQDWWRASPC